MKKHSFEETTRVIKLLGYNDLLVNEPRDESGNPASNAGSVSESLS